MTFSNAQSVDDLLSPICCQNWCGITECCRLYNRHSLPKQSGPEYANSAPWRRDQVSSASSCRWHHHCGNRKGSLFRNKTRLKRNKNPAWISPKSVRNGRKITKFSTSPNRKYAVPISWIFLEMRNLRLLVNMWRYPQKADATGRRSWAMIFCWRDLKRLASFEGFATNGKRWRLPKCWQVSVSQHFRARHNVAENSEYEVLQCVMLYYIIPK